MSPFLGVPVRQADRAILLAVALVLMAPLSVVAQNSAPAAASPSQQRDPTWTQSSGVRITLFPSGDVFPVYVADPHRPSNAIAPRFYAREGLVDASSPRAWLSAGGRFGMLRIESAGPSQRSWQVGIEAGLDAMFDTQHRSDGIGWDGNYGLTVTTASTSRWSFKIAMLHVSAHLGDEYADRTGHARINYTREELAVGTAVRLSSRWRLYGELACAYILRNEDQQPWRAQAGLEYESVMRLWGGRFAWFSAADFASWQERSWRVDGTLQAGLVTRSDGRTYRILLEYNDGRPPLGEFFKVTEASLAFVFRIDLG
jgi:hypothetical protein